MQQLLAILLGSAVSLSFQTGPSARPAGSATPGAGSTVTRPADAEKTIRLATWNVENWHTNFEAWRRRDERPSDETAAERLRQERYQNDEDQWEIAQVFQDPTFSPDVVVIQEGPTQEELEQFNQEWLDGMYETVIIFPNNSERVQTVGAMLKPGFRVIERRDDYYQIPDPDDLNPRSDKLFARGPAFLLVEAAGGYRFWVGTTHQKSKGGNDVPTTRWRNAEATATRQIMTQLRGQGSDNVILLGDMNDELGIQSYELEGGGDVIANLVGPPQAGFHLATRELAESGHQSFMGYWRPTYRSFIDHIVISQQTLPEVADVQVYDTPIARVASDHLPVFIDLKPEE